MNRLLLKSRNHHGSTGGRNCYSFHCSVLSWDGKIQPPPTHSRECRSVALEVSAARLDVTNMWPSNGLLGSYMGVVHSYLVTAPRWVPYHGSGTVKTLGVAQHVTIPGKMRTGNRVHAAVRVVFTRGGHVVCWLVLLPTGLFTTLETWYWDFEINFEKADTK